MDLLKIPLDWWPDDALEEYEERAAIMQHDGGMTREAAEESAWARVAHNWTERTT